MMANVDVLGCFIVVILRAVSGQDWRDIIGSPIETCSLNNMTAISAETTASLKKKTALSGVIASMNARSNIECTATCLNKNGCDKLYFEDTTGTCYMMNDVIENQSKYAPESQITVDSGSFLEIQADFNNILHENTELRSLDAADDVCTIRSCSQSGTCRKDCASGERLCLGSLDDCTELPISNTYFQIWHAGNWGGDNYRPLINLNYYKKYEWTGLKVKWRGNFRMHLAGGQGCLWFTFNSQDCFNPGPIKYNLYTQQLQNNYKHTDFEGTCNGIPKGLVQVNFHVNGCGTTTTTDVFTGWHQTNYVIVEEVDNRPNSGGLCAHLSSFNEREYFMNFYYGEDTRFLANVVYVKRDPASALRVLYQGNMGSYGGSSKCVRWYFKFNGTECSNPTKIEMSFALLSGDVHWMRETNTLEGMCYNLPAGPVNIELFVGACSCCNLADSLSGWESYERIRVNEVHLGLDTNAVMLPNGTILQLPNYNIRHWQWSNINYGSAQGVIKEVTYPKLSATSTLRVTFNSNFREGIQSHCSEWHVKFNTSECGNPHYIDASFHGWNNGGATNQLRPFLLDGYCKNLPAGDVQVKIEVGVCETGHSIGDSYTGYYTMTSLTVEEVHLGI